MAWQEELVPIVRQLINDTGSSPTYSNSQIEESIVITAQLIIIEVYFSQTYTIDITELEISPDPTSNTRDDAFITLVSLKTACIILGADVSASTAQAIKITDGPSTIDGSTVFYAKLQRYKDICSSYEKARRQYSIGNAINAAAVLGPYTNESVDIIPWNF